MTSLWSGVSEHASMSEADHLTTAFTPQAEQADVFSRAG